MYFLTLVFKNVFRRKIRSLLTITGVAIAVVVVISLVGIADDFETSMGDLYEHRGVDLVIVRARKTERLTSLLDERLGEVLKGLPDVKGVDTSLVDIVSFEKANLLIVPIQGRYPETNIIDDLKITKGRRLRNTDDLQTMIGGLLAKQLDKTVGDQVEIEGEKFDVVGVYESFNAFENGSAMVPLWTLQRILDRPKQVTGFSVQVGDIANKAEVIERLRKRIEELKDEKGRSLNLSAMPTRDFMASTFELQAARGMAWVTSVIALLIGAIGMLNTMSMSVFERTREVGVLRAIGWRRMRVVRMILLEAVLLSACGAVLGVIGAALFHLAFHNIPAASMVVPATMNPYAVAMGVVIALLVGFLGGIYPAVRAMNLPPTEALRHE